MRIVTIFLLLFCAVSANAAEIVDSSLKDDCTRAHTKIKCLEAKIRKLNDALIEVQYKANHLEYEFKNLPKSDFVTEENLQKKIKILDTTHEENIDEALSATLSHHNDSLKAHDAVVNRLAELRNQVTQLVGVTKALGETLNSIDQKSLGLRRDIERSKDKDVEIENRQDEMEISISDRTKIVDDNVKALQDRLNAYADDYVKDSDFSLELGTLSNKLEELDRLNKTLGDRFKTVEQGFEKIASQLIDQTKQLSEVDQKLIELDGLNETLARLEGEISSNKTHLTTLSGELSSLSAVAQVVDINKDTLSKHNDSLRQILVDYESIQKQLFRLDSETKRLDDIMAFNKIDIESMLKRLDELEIIQPELSEQSFLRDRLSEIQYKQSMMDEDKSLIAELQSRILSLEAKLERFENIEKKMLILEEKLQDFETNQQKADPPSGSSSSSE